MQVLHLVVLAAGSGLSSSLSLKSQAASSMSMEAMMEAQMFAKQTARLEQFGVNYPEHHAPEHSEVTEVPATTSRWSAETLFPWLHFISFSFLLKSGAIVSSFMGQMSPLPVIWTVKASQDTMQYPPFTFFCVFCCGLQWCVYGIFAFVVTRNYGFLILVYANACGVIMGAYYVSQYYRYCKIETRQRQLSSCAYMAVLSFATQALVIADVPHSRALLIVGTVSAGLSVMVTAAPLAELSTILKTKDVSSLPPEYVCCQFFASSLWFGCGLLLHDTWILVPNVFGLVLGGFQIFLLMNYGNLAQSLSAGLSMKAQPAFIEQTKPASYGTLSTASEPASPVPAPIACTGGTD